MKAIKTILLSAYILLTIMAFAHDPSEEFNNQTLQKMEHKAAAEKEVIIVGAGDVTKSKIQEWINEYDGGILAIEVPVDETYNEMVLGIVKVPKDEILNVYLRTSDNDPMGATALLLNTIWLGGDVRIKENRECRIAYVKQLMDEISGGQAKRIKNPDKVKKAHPEKRVISIAVPKDKKYEDYLIGSVRYPNDGQLNDYIRKSDRAPILAGKELIEKIWLAGDEAIKSERKYQLSFMTMLSEVMEGGQGKLRTLDSLLA